MKILVAPSAEPAKPGSYCFTEPGEIVQFIFCKDWHSNPDDLIAFIGLKTRKGTTQAVVADVKSVRSKKELIGRISRSVQKAWSLAPEDAHVVAKRDGERIAAFCFTANEGDVVEITSKGLYVVQEDTP